MVGSQIMGSEISSPVLRTTNRILSPADAVTLLTLQAVGWVESGWISVHPDRGQICLSFSRILTPAVRPFPALGSFETLPSIDKTPFAGATNTRATSDLAPACIQIRPIRASPDPLHWPS